jgi:hypothetical protein
MTTPSDDPLLRAMAVIAQAGLFHAAAETRAAATAAAAQYRRSAAAAAEKFRKAAMTYAQNRTICDAMDDAVLALEALSSVAAKAIKSYAAAQPDDQASMAVANASRASVEAAAEDAGTACSKAVSAHAANKSESNSG